MPRHHSTHTEKPETGCKPDEPVAMAKVPCRGCLLLIVLLSFVTAIFAVDEGDEPNREQWVDTLGDERDREGREDWVDPGDMVNYDLSTSKMRKSAEKESTAPKDSTQPETKDATRQDAQAPPQAETDGSSAARIQTLEKELRTCNIQRTEHKLSSVRYRKLLDEKPVGDEPFFKQYMTQLLRRFEKDLEHDMFYRLTAKLSPDDFITLEKFTSSEYGNIHDAHHVLSEMVLKVETVGEYRPPTWLSIVGNFLKDNKDTILQVTCSVALVCVSTVILLRLRFEINPYRMAGKIVFFLFLISIFWTWWHLYKIEVAKQHATLVKGMPKHCKPSGSLTMWEAFSQSFSLKMDECAEYHEKIMVDPFVAVPPTKALAVTITKFFTEPLEHVGRAMGRTLTATLNEVPGVLIPFVLPVMLIILLLAVFRLLGLRLRVFPFLTLEPAHVPAVAAAPAAAQPAVAAAPAAAQPAVAAAPAAAQPAVAAAPAAVVAAKREPQRLVGAVQPAPKPVKAAPQPHVDELRAQEAQDDADGTPVPAAVEAELPAARADEQPTETEAPVPEQHAVEEVQPPPQDQETQRRDMEARYDPLHRTEPGEEAQAAGATPGAAGDQPHGGARPKQPRRGAGSGDASNREQELKMPIPETQPHKEFSRVGSGDAGRVLEPEEKETSGIVLQTDIQTGESTTISDSVPAMLSSTTEESLSLEDNKQGPQGPEDTSHISGEWHVVTPSETGSEGSSTDVEVLPTPADSDRSAIQNIGPAD